ncbi:MAG TPA: hypothetical protein ENJ10_02230 [Caldithrix abyssi]|uniref:Metallo-beta-lactamase domain-containing protein n=1 Tax=Caldithrix abyssi TaxID=187145 RepID=A0A7V1PU51_CALAY|nr:hypothetical protein [Caldithrix abyssi]
MNITNQTSMDNTKPFEIAHNIYWIGKKTGFDLEMNVYLRIFEKDNRKINMLIDPGPPTDFDIIEQNLKTVLGKDFKIHFAFINHQDPDVGYNALFFQRYFPNMQIITTEDTWRLIRFYGLNPKKFIAVDKFKSRSIKMITGHKLTFVPTPYCHFRGACALYDVSERILFSGDFFGGLTEHPGFFATEKSWPGIKIFQQIYMPTNTAIENAISEILKVDPEPVMIAPQHGVMIKDDFVQYYIDKIKNLSVGLDLYNQNKIKISQYIEAIRQITHEVKTKFDKKVYDDLQHLLHTDDSFPEIFSIRDDEIYDIKIAAEDALQYFITKLLRNPGGSVKKDLHMLILRVLAGLNLPGDNLSLEATETDHQENTNETLFEEEVPDTNGAEENIHEDRDHLNIRKLLEVIEEESGSDKFNELTILRIMLKIPPDILKRNQVNSYNDFFQLEETRDQQFIQKLITACESVIGRPLPEKIWTNEEEDGK